MTNTSKRFNKSQCEQVKTRTLLRAIHNSNVSVLYQSPDLHYLWFENLPRCWNISLPSDMVSSLSPPPDDTTLMPPAIASRLIAAKKILLEKNEAQRLEISFDYDRNLRWYEFFIDTDKDNTGRTIGIVTTAVEISELKHREEILKILLREVSHRSKNLLAIIQSISVQTARFTGTVDSFLEKFHGRLQSLSKSQDLVTASNWQGARFRQLLHSQIDKYVNCDTPLLSITGQDVYLFPNAALHIGLALHELIVNSTSYGGQARPNGRLHITTKIEHNGAGEPEFVILWQETVLLINSTKALDGSTVGTDDNEPQIQSPRFGSAVLERIVPQAVNGTVSYHISNEYVEYKLRIPHSNFDF